MPLLSRATFTSPAGGSWSFSSTSRPHRRCAPDHGLPHHPQEVAPLPERERSSAAVERAGRLGFGLNPLAPSWEALEEALGSFRDAARKAGHDPQKLPVIVRANTAVGEEYAPEGEPPLSGSHEKVVEDLERLREMDVDEVFFDMNRYAVPVKEQFRILERLRAVVA